MEPSLESGRPFPEHVTTILESFYKRGMSGWSGNKAAIFQEALGRTPLDESQLKVSFFFLFELFIKIVYLCRTGLSDAILNVRMLGIILRQQSVL